MQVSLGKKGDYAVRATVSLARRHGARVKAREIAEEMSIPRDYLPQVLATLVRAGLVGSAAGPGGGYFLTRPPEQISLRDVVEAAEGPIKSGRCLLRGGPCAWRGTCLVHEHWVAAQDALIERLEATTFADICDPGAGDAEEAAG